MQKITTQKFHMGHLRCPTSHLLPSHISSVAVSIPVVLNAFHRAHPPLSSPLTLSFSPTSRVSVAVLITLSSIIPFTSPLFFVYLLLLDLISLCIVLYYTACSALLHTTLLTIFSDILNTIFFSLLARIFYISVIFSLSSDLPCFSPLTFTPLCFNLIITFSSV